MTYMIRGLGLGLRGLSLSGRDVYPTHSEKYRKSQSREHESVIQLQRGESWEQ